MSSGLPIDIRIRNVELRQIPCPMRVPLKFGAVVVADLTLLAAKVLVENKAGRVDEGWGAMPAGTSWSWPAAKAEDGAKVRAMVEIEDAYAKAVTAYNHFAHPIEIFMENEPTLPGIAESVCKEATPGEVMPLLGALNAISPIDMAVHDAFGNVNGMDSYLGYGRQHMSWDLSRYLGEKFENLFPAQFLRAGYQAELPLFHLVGALDPLTERDVPDDAPRDGVPNSLESWIRRDGVFCLKIKLKGNDLDWDAERTLAVSRIYAAVRAEQPHLPRFPNLTVDTNEQCESPDYMIELLQRIREADEQVFDQVLYLEQPTERDLKAHRWDMRPLGALKPVLLDESLMSLEDYELGMSQGWSGPAIKTCKCLSACLLVLARAEIEGRPYAIQDLTCSGISLLGSVGFAARTRPVCGVEGNSRQFVPSANEPESRIHPGIFAVRNGLIRTDSLTGTGLGLRMAENPRRL